VFQRGAIEILHGDEALSFVLADLVDGAYAGMVQGRGGAGFAMKTLKRLGILGHVFRQEFEGDESAESDVLGLIDHAHPAAADSLKDAIVRRGLPNHWTEIVGPRGRLVNLGWTQFAIRGTG
jgi:hypothetical protein